MRGASHGAYILLIKADSNTVAGCQDNFAVAVSQFNTNQILIIVQINSNHAILAHAFQILEVDFLNSTLIGSHKHVLFFSEFLHRNNSRNLFARH